MIRTTLLAAAFALVAAGPALADGDAAHGKTVFARCSGCHTIDGKANPVGPTLKGVAGGPAGKGTYAYSKAMAASNLTWDDATLDTYLAGPTKVVPGTKMTLSVANATDRADVIAYLKTLK